ncbi:MAG: sensor histidine kinase [Acidobacteriota bacterium]|nr:sensor histidine kinase [Acidobacteriota bacterium]
MRLRLLPESSPLGWTPYAWLIYLPILIVYSLAINDSATDWVIDGATIVVFLVLYFRGFWVGGDALLRIAFAIVALGVLCTPRNPGASVFFIYGAAFLGEAARTPAIATRWLLLIVGIVAVEAWLAPLPPQAWIPGIVFSVIVGGTNIHYGEMRRKDQALVRAHRAAEKLATVAERERIARDLHDLLGHTLSVIVIKAELASKLSDIDPARAAEEIRDVERISRNALQEVRSAIHGYRGERVQDELASARTALTAASVTLTSDIEPAGLDVDAERALAFGLREAITNVIRHARAARCEITLTRDADGVRLIVQDDGQGGTHPEGAGLSGMRARLELLGGTLERDGRRGTRLTLRVPDARATRMAQAAS